MATFPSCKEVEECGQLYINPIEAKILVRGPYTLAWISGTPICLCGLVLEKKLTLGARGCYEGMAFTYNVFRVKSYIVFKRRGLAHDLSFQISVLNVGYQSREEKERQKKISEEK